MAHKQQVLDKAETRAVERLIVDTQFLIHQLMIDEGVSRAELAKRLNCSKSRITQMFGDHPNLTLETLARVFFALNDKCRVTSDKAERVMQAINAQVELEAKKSKLSNAEAEKWVVRDAYRAGFAALIQAVTELSVTASGNVASPDPLPVHREVRTVKEVHHSSEYHRSVFERYKSAKRKDAYLVAA